MYGGYFRFQNNLHSQSRYNISLYIHQTSIHCIRASLLPVTIIHVFHSDTDTQEAHSLYQYAQQCDSTEEPEDDSRSDPPCMYSINSHPFMFHILISLFNLYLLIYICGLFFYHNLDKFKITKVWLYISVYYKYMLIMSMFK